MKWEDRRRTLFLMCDTIKDIDIINKNESLKALSGEIIQKYKTIDSYEKLVDSKLKEINKSMSDIPIRINELEKTISVLPELSLEELKSSLEVIQKQKQQQEQELLDLKAKSSIAAQESEISLKLTQIETKYNVKKNEHDKAFYEQLTAFDSKLDIEYKKEAELKFSIQKNQFQVREKEFAANNLRKEWTILNAQKFETDTTCPTCKQAIPVDEIEKATTEFNISKSEKLTEITTKGKALKAEVEALNESINKLETEESELHQKISDLETQKSNLKNPADNLKLDDLQERKALLQQREELKNNTSTDNGLAQLQEIISALESNIKEIQASIAKHEAINSTNERIKDLIREEKDFAKEYQQWQKAKNLCEEFTKKKIETVENIINSKFKSTKFKLFNLQVNGELKECCESTFNGVPYSDLNKAQTINTGIDIINVLSEYYGIKVPLWVDNSESITKLADIETQVIKLVVSEQDKVLRVEVQS